MDKRKAIIDRAILQGGVISKMQAVETIGKTYYCNADKHVGDILTRMVKAGVLERVQWGVYKVIQANPKKGVKPIDQNQAALF
jgi:predicted transcriptional regulator of viral defense system